MQDRCRKQAVWYAAEVMSILRSLGEGRQIWNEGNSTPDWPPSHSQLHVSKIPRVLPTGHTRQQRCHQPSPDAVGYHEFSGSDTRCIFCLSRHVGKPSGPYLQYRQKTIGTWRMTEPKLRHVLVKVAEC